MRCCALAMLAACSFRHGAASSIASDAVDGPADTITDTIDAPAGLCGGKVWLADFSTDPTTYDHNGDGTNDFAMRDGGALGGTLAAGVWTEASTTTERALDTQPRQPFVTRTLVHVRMRDTMMPAPGQHGALFWINVGYDGTNFSPLFVDAALQAGGTQTATLEGKTSGSTETVLAQVTFLDTGMHDYYLDIDPVGHVVTFTVDALTLTPRAFPSFAAAGNTDQWATVVASTMTTAEFDLERVEVCP